MSRGYTSAVILRGAAARLIAVCRAGGEGGSVITARLRCILVAFAVLASLAPLAADEGWVIERLHVEFDLQTDGSIEVREAFDVDFRALERHGILRDLVAQQIYDQERNRRY